MNTFKNFTHLKKFINFKNQENLLNFRYMSSIEEEDFKKKFNRYFIDIKEVEEYFLKYFEIDIAMKFYTLLNNFHRKEMKMEQFLDFVFFLNNKKMVHTHKTKSFQKLTLVCNSKTRRYILYYYQNNHLPKILATETRKVRLLMHKNIINNIILDENIGDGLVCFLEKKCIDIVFSEDKIIKKDENFICFKNFFIIPKNYNFAKFNLSTQDYSNKENFYKNNRFEYMKFFYITDLKEKK